MNTFRELGAAVDLARAEEELRISLARLRNDQEQSALTQLLTLRLAEAVASRELLLRELAAVMRQETGAQRVIITNAANNTSRASSWRWVVRRLIA